MLALSPYVKFLLWYSCCLVSPQHMNFASFVYVQQVWFAGEWLGPHFVTACQLIPEKGKKYPSTSKCGYLFWKEREKKGGCLIDYERKTCSFSTSGNLPFLDDVKNQPQPEVPSILETYPHLTSQQTLYFPEQSHGPVSRHLCFVVRQRQTSHPRNILCHGALFQLPPWHQQSPAHLVASSTVSPHTRHPNMQGCPHPGPATPCTHPQTL